MSRTRARLTVRSHSVGKFERRITGAYQSACQPATCHAGAGNGNVPADGRRGASRPPRRRSSWIGASARMAILFRSTPAATDRWRPLLGVLLPEHEIRYWPEIGDTAAIEYALVWQPEP